MLSELCILHYVLYECTIWLTFWFTKFYENIAATERSTDVVLVDTAGRMQDNEPLMRSLAKVLIIAFSEII